VSGRYSSGGQRPAQASVQALLAELLGALGFRAMAEQARAETDPEKHGLYARIILRQAPADRRPIMRERLEALGLLG
jgi:hypothetical protein